MMLGKVSFVLALRERAFQSSERSVQSDDTTNGQPAVKARGKADPNAALPVKSLWYENVLENQTFGPGIRRNQGY